MGFRDILAPALGIGCMGQSVYSSPARFRIFEVPPESEGDDARIGFSSYTGAFIGYIPLDIQNVKFRNIRFVVDEQGPKEFDFELNSDPGIPLLRFSECVFSISDVNVFRGYIWGYPGPEKKPEETWKYKGKGIRERLKNRKIALKPGENIYTIDEITSSGSDMIITTVEPIQSVGVGQVAIVQEPADDANAVRGDITAVGTNTVTVTNPAAVSDTTDKGLLYVLPAEWSDPTTRVSDFLKQVVSSYLSELPVSQTTDFIADSDHVLTGSVVDVDGMQVDELFRHIRQIAPGWRLHINTESQIVFEEKPASPVGVFVIGYDGHEADEQKDDDSVVNRWYVNRKEGRETDRSGFKNGAIATDDTSRALYGLIEDEEDVPVYYGDDLCEKIAEGLLQQTKDPLTTIKVKKVPFQHYEIGPWLVVTPPRESTYTVVDPESLPGWTAGPGITASLNTTNLVKGAAAIELQYDSSAIGSTYVYNTDLILTEATMMRVWYRCTRIGQELVFGFGETSYTEHQHTVYGYSTQWRPLDIPLEGVDIQSVGQIGFRIVDSGYGSGGDTGGVDRFLFDEISVEMVYARHLELDLTEVEYVLGEERYCNLTFGQRRSELDQWLAGVFRKLKNQRIALQN